MISNTIPKQTIKPGDKLHGFRLEEVEELDSVKSKTYFFVHEQTGCRLLHVHNTDDNNLFAIGFKTPPRDSTGVAHILEHSVLGGSRKYKVKDPFNEMAKGSMSTFINAFTFPDKTIYPVSSKIPKDFFHLVEVYLDAVFYPTLSEMTFGQEGHRLEFSDPENPASELVIKGIVYNEMKGVYSNLDSVVSEASFRRLFPDSVYGNDSGGNPEAIPNLRYEDFKKFHADYYNPSNARIYVSGNIPSAKILEFLQTEYLKDFQQVPVKSQIDPQPRWQSPKQLETTFPAQADETDFALTINWLNGSILDPLETTAMMIVDEIILGNSAAVLRKTLIDSHLGKALTPGAGYSTETLETFFSVGLKGVAESDLDKVERLIHDTLQKIAETGFSSDDLERAFHQIEFHNSEIRGGGIPFDVNLMVTAFQSWLYDGHPNMYIDLRPYLDQIKDKLKSEPDYLVQVFRRNILENPHSVTIKFRPDSDYVKKREDALKDKLSELKTGLDSDTQTKIIEFSKSLLEEQRRPTSPEDLATLPAISISDIPREIEVIPFDEESRCGTKLIHNDLFTNGIEYFELYFDASGIRGDDVKLLPIFCLALSGMGVDSNRYTWSPSAPADAGGTAGPGADGEAQTWLDLSGPVKMSYDAFSNLKSLKTGGVGAHFVLAPQVDDPAELKFGLSLGGKSLPRNFRSLLAIIRNIILFPDFGDKKRLREILIQQQAALKSSLVPNGIRYAWGYGSSQLSPGAHLKEYWSGLHYVQMLDGILGDEEHGLDKLIAGMERIRSALFQPENLTVHYIGPKETLQGEMAGFIEQLVTYSGKVPPAAQTPPAAGGKSPLSGFQPAAATGHLYTGVALEAEVSYATLVFPTCPYSHEAAPYFYFLQNFLSSGFLNDRIRVESGAYGGFASYFGLEGIMGFGSYRDPNIINTVKTFHEALDIIKEGKFDDAEIERTLIGALSGLDRPMTPAAAGNASFSRWLSGMDNGLRRRFRETLLDLDKQKLNAAVEPILSKADTYLHTIVASRSNLEQLQTELKLDDMRIYKVDEIP